MWKIPTCAAPLPPERRGRRAPALLALLARLTAAALLLAASVVAAQPFRYTVTLAVPEDQRKLLEDNLEIYTARQNPRMDAEQLRLLVKRTPEQIRGLLATEGFYTPAVEPSLEERGGAWIARFNVAPGDTSKVSRVDIELSGAIGPDERAARLARMRERWPLKAGMVFRQAQWEESKRAVLQVLLTDTYPAATIASSEASVDPQTRTVSLRMTLDSGPAFSFGQMQVSGLKRYPRSIVERLNVLLPGTPYSQAKVLEFQSRLQDSRYFSSALVTADIDPARADDATVQVQLVEVASRKLGFGAGASTNTGLRGQVEYEDLNFMNRALRLSSLLKLENKTQLLSGNLEFPRAADGALDSLNALTERTDISGQTTRKLALGARRARAIGDTETATGLQFVTERQDIAGAPGDAQQALVPSYTWTRRKVDNMLYPSEGFLLSAQIGAAARVLASDQDFLRLYAKATHYRKVGKSGGLILRGELGSTLAKSRLGIPSNFLFRTGGDQSVRGYAYQSLGVKSGDAVVGGRYLALASAEYVQWLTPNWGAALFYDAGTATDSLRNLKPVHGYGIGARWRSPVGLLNLDLAYGQEVKRMRMHFSVGIFF